MAFTWLSGFSVDGNVGIGTLSSGAALTLQTAPDAQALNIIGRSDGLGFLQFFGSDGSTLYGSIGGSSSGLSFAGNVTLGGLMSVANNATFGGNIIFSKNNPSIGLSTSDGNDNQVFKLYGGGSASGSRGAVIQLFGNEHATNSGELYLAAGSGYKVKIASEAEFSTNATFKGSVFIEGADKSIRINNGTQPVVYLGDGGANTDGQLLLYSSAGAVNVVFNGDNQNHYIVNGNLGIGTSGPTKKLHVLNSENEAQIRLGQSGSGSYDLGVYADDTFSIGRDADTQEFNIKNGNVGIGTTSPGAKLDVDGAGKFSGQVTIPETPVADTDAASKAYVDSKTLPGTFVVRSKNVTISQNFATVCTVNLSNHTGCYVTVTCFGDWPSHSTAAYRGEFFLQNGAGGHAEPGMIIRQDDNTSDSTDQIIAQIVDPPSSNPANFIIQLRHTDTSAPVGFTGVITFTVQGQFNSVS